MTEKEEAKKRVEEHFQIYYRRSIDDLDITDVPGYWEEKEAQMHRGHPLHNCIGNEGPFKATYTYFDRGRNDKGRFSSPYKTWRLLKGKN